MLLVDARSSDKPIIWCNKAFELLTGYSRDEVIGRNCRFLQGNDRDQPALDEIRQAMQREEKVITILRNYRKNGELFWNEVAISPVLDDTGQVTHYVGIQTDVTNLKKLASEHAQAESKAHRSEQQLNRILQASPDMMFVIDSEHRYVDCQPRDHSRYFVPPDQFIGKKVDDVLPREVGSYIKELVGSVIKTHEAREGKYALPFPDGKRYFECRIFPFEKDQALAIIRDVTALQLANHELHERESELSYLYETMAQGVIYQNQHGHIIKANPAAVKLLPLDKQSNGRFDWKTPRFKPIREDGSNYPEHEHPAMVALRSGKAVDNAIIGLLDEESQRRTWLQVSSRPVYDNPAQNPTRAFTTFTDITESKEAEEHLRALLDNMPIPLAINGFSRKTEVNFINREFTRAFGYTIEDIPTVAHFAERAYPDVEYRIEIFEWWENMLQTAKQNQTPVESKEVRIVCKNGVERIVEISAHLMEHSILVTFLDITELQKTIQMLQKQSQILELLNELATRFINLPSEDFKEAINQALARLGSYFESDRIYLFDLDWEKNTASNTYEWCMPHIEPQLPNLQDVPVDGLEDWMDNFKQGKPYIVEDIGKLDKNDPARQLLEPQGILSIVTVPLIDAGHCVGFLGLDAVSKKRTFLDSEIKMLQAFASGLLSLTKRLQGSREQEKSRRFLSDLIETSGSIIAVKNQTGAYTLVNRAWENITGISRKHALGKRDSVLFPRVIAQQFMENDFRAMNTHKPVEVEEFLDDSLGRHHFISTKFPVYDFEGLVTGVCTIMTDITQRKHVEKIRQGQTRILQTLAESKPRNAIFEQSINFLQEIIPGSRCAILLRETNHLRAVSAPALSSHFQKASVSLYKSEQNPSERRLSLFENEEWVENLTTRDQTHPLHKLAAEDGMHCGLLMPIFCSNNPHWGTIAVYWNKAHTLDAEENNLIRIVADLIALALEKDKAIQDQINSKAIEAASNARNHFIAGMSHDIHTPLNAIIGFVDVLMRDDNLNEKQLKLLQTIKRNGKHLLVLIADLLNLSALDSGNIRLQNAACDIREIIEDIHSMFTPKAAYKSLAFTFQVDESVPERLILDDQKLRQVITNLVSNAIKFTQNGHVRIHAKTTKLSAKDYKLTITVEDTGCGIKKESLPSLFDPFWREAPDADGSEGTGLGMSIVKHLIDTMQGSIKVKSIPDQGTLITFHVVSSISDTDVLLHSDSNQKKARVNPNPRAFNIMDLPSDLIQALQVALQSGDVATMTALIEQIKPQYPDIAAYLGTKLDNFDYSALRKILIKTGQ